MTAEKSTTRSSSSPMPSSSSSFTKAAGAALDDELLLDMSDLPVSLEIFGETWLRLLYSSSALARNAFVTTVTIVYVLPLIIGSNIK